MIIRDFVLQQNDMGINEWLAAIANAKLLEHENLILECANHYNKITINHNASFINAINL